MSVAAYNNIIQGPLSSYLSLSSQIGGDVALHAKLVREAFQTQLQYIQLAASRAAPSSKSEEMQLLQPTSQKIQAIQDLREKNRASPHFNHLSAVSESIPALGWVTVSPAPAPHVKEMNDAGQFYTNRVLKDWKQKDQKHVDWAKAWVETLSELQKYIKQHHTTGLVWSGTKSGGGAPPPPPPGCPPPPPVLPQLGDLTLDDSANDRSALFAEINQGENITRNLKKVTADMQTHKNPGLRSGPAPFKAPASTGAPTTALVKPPANKPPVFARDGKKWLVEHQHKNQNLIIDEAEMNNVVYMYGCTESTLTVKGKLNSVFLDSCKKSAVVFDSLVSSIEFVNCQSVQMQVLGKVPTISIDKTDGCQIYLSKDSLEVEIISSKSSEMNVLVPKANGDFAEFPVPEQFKTTVKPTGLTTVAIESKG
ncbi:adenylyl cyclase-associated protein 1 isoform X2 [Lycorma delicatula]